MSLDPSEAENQRTLCQGSFRFSLNFITCLFKHTTGPLESKIHLTNLVFSVFTVSYGPSISPSIYGPSASCLGHKSMGKNKDL